VGRACRGGTWKKEALEGGKRRAVVDEWKQEGRRKRKNEKGGYYGHFMLFVHHEKLFC